MSSSKSTTGVLCVNPEHTRKLVQRQNNIRKRGSASKRQTKVAMQWLQKNSKMCFDDIWVIRRRVKNWKVDQIDWKPYMYTAISIYVVGSKPQAYKTRPKGNMGS